ncbi:MAG: tetratricopeptide repeat protein [Candidatus Obscuribacterales bacterium]|nr:tetratricopeptide repeat protein [Candidatus Obscuribacterales bacterium]
MSKEAVQEEDEDLKDGKLLEQARELFERADLAGSFLLSKEHWLNYPEDLCAVKLICEIMRKNGKKELYKHLKVLSSSQEALLNNAQSLFETAYQFIDEREPELAVMLLGRCAQLEPEQTVIRYELGFALMQLRRFDEAIEEFEQLMHEADFDTRLNLTVCHSITRNLNRARELTRELEKMAGNQEEKKELALRNWVIKRLEKFDSKQNLDLRDWVYALYGSVLLCDTTPKDLSGKPRSEAADYPGVASTLLLLQGFIREMGLEFDIIEYYSPVSRPLAEALASVMELSAESYKGPERKERALLIMAWASDIIGPHKAFVTHSPRRTLFAYGLTTLAQLPVTPDIIGCLAGECSMPWSKQLEELDENERPDAKPHPMNQIQEQATNAILSKMSDLESSPEILKQVQDLQAYYSIRKAFLLLDNSSSFPERPEYTAEIPF